MDVEDEDAWDFGTIKQAPPPQPKLSLRMQNSPSQYSISSFTTEKQSSPPPSVSPNNSQLPRTVSRTQVNSQQPPQPSPPNTRVNEVTVSLLLCIKLAMDRKEKG